MKEETVLECTVSRVPLVKRVPLVRSVLPWLDHLILQYDPKPLNILVTLQLR